MQILKTNQESATVQLTKKELIILANAINESREAIEDWEFSTRMGVEPGTERPMTTVEQREKLRQSSVPTFIKIGCRVRHCGTDALSSHSRSRI